MTVLSGRWFSPLLLAAFVLTNMGPGFSLRGDGPGERQAFSGECRTLFETGKYTELEALGKQLRADKAKFTEGVWKLPSFYDGLETTKAQRQKDLAAYEGRLAAWEKEIPGSLTVPVLKAELLIKLAWEARGSGFANTVTDQGWRVFAERLKEAREVLVQARADAKGEVCPQWFSVMMTVALGQGWELGEFDLVFDEAVKKEPTYYSYYFKKAYYLLPRWHGEEGDWEAFALLASTKWDGKEGLTVYTRTAWYMVGFYDNLFKDSRVEWPKMKQGFEDIMKDYPHSYWNLRNYVMFAWKAGDKETVKELFARMETPAFRAQLKEDNKLLVLKGSLDPAAVSKPAWSVQLPGAIASGSNFALSPDGQTIAVVGEAAAILFYEAASGKKIKNSAAIGEVLSCVAFSADGKYLAVGGGQMSVDEKGFVKVLEWPSLNLKVEVSDFTARVRGVCFAPDSTKLYAVGGLKDKSAEAKEIDLDSGAIKAAWKADHSHHLSFLALSPSGDQWVVNCNGNLQAVDVKSGEDLYKKRLETTGYITEAVFAPDGAALITSAGKWPGGKGYLYEWDTKNWEYKDLGEKLAFGASRSIDISPDGQWLALAADDGSVRIVERANGKQVQLIPTGEGRVNKVRFLAGGQRVAIMTGAGLMSVWEVKPRGGRE